jgi:hypothetical protein
LLSFDCSEWGMKWWLFNDSNEYIICMLNGIKLILCLTPPPYVSLDNDSSYENFFSNDLKSWIYTFSLSLSHYPTVFYSIVKYLSIVCLNESSGTLPPATGSKLLHLVCEFLMIAPSHSFLGYFIFESALYALLWQSIWMKLAWVTV